MDIDLLALLGFNRSEEFDPPKLWAAAVPGGSIMVPVGATEGGAAIRLDFGRFSGTDHALIVGAPGSGTSTLLRTVMGCLAVLRPTDQLGFLAIEAQPGVPSFEGVADIPHCSGVVNPRHGASGTASRVSQWLMGEIERRRESFDTIGVTNISEYQVLATADKAAGADTRVFPELFVVVDDITWLLDTEFDIISRILRADGHALGIRMIMAAPYDTWVQLKDSGYFDQITARFTLGLDSSQSTSVFGTAVADNLQAPGQAYVRTDDGELLRCQVISADELYQKR